MTEGPYLINRDSASIPQRMKDDLMALADAYLDMPPLSVMDKDKTPPSGDKHDWMNLAEYLWPNPDTPDGLPYVHRDGEVNPELSLYDRPRFNLLVLSVLRLGVVWQVTGKTVYADKAVLLLRHWFTESDTAMNPHLRFAHYTPGITDGTIYGLITFCTTLPSIMDVWLAFRRAGLVDESLHTSMSRWADAFLEWLLTDPMGIEHAESKNNHGTWHDFLVAYLMLFLNKEEAAGLIENSLGKRLSTQVSVNGEQPMETKRTLCAQYSLFNLKALMSLARLGEAVSVHGWGCDGSQPAILQATEFLYKHAAGDAPWPYRQIEPPNWWFLKPLCVIANKVYGDSFDLTRIPMDVAIGAVPVEPVVFVPGWELVFAPSHQQHLPMNPQRPNTGFRRRMTARLIHSVLLRDDEDRNQTIRAK